jgi:hypothetical protein
MKLKELFENTIPVYKGDIRVPEDWKDLSGLPELYPGYTAGCILEGKFDCSYCKVLTSLEGAPSSTHDFLCFSCNSLTSLKGAPTNSTHKFDCSFCNDLSSLEGAPSSTHNFDCSYCSSLTSLKGIGKDYLTVINEIFYGDKSGIKSNILGLLKVKNLKVLSITDDKKLEEIINRHLKTKNILECQEELIENGYKEFAKL